MRVIIVGIGSVGNALTERLLKEKHDVVVIDEDAELVESMVNRLDVQGVVGSGFERNVLVNANAEKTDFFFACTQSDEMNILCCILAKKMGVKFAVARVRDPHYFSSVQTLKEDIGVDMLFNPEYRTAMEIAKILKFPSAISTDTFASGRVNLTEFVISKGNPIVGLTVQDAVKMSSSKILFAVVARDSKVFIPKGDFVIEAGDHVYIAAEDSELTSFCKKLHIFKQRAKSVLIVGGGKIAYFLAKELLSAGVEVKIIESDEERCVTIDEELPRATVICADGADTLVLDEEGIKDADAVVALTGIDEKNAVVSLYAMSQTDGKVVTQVTSPALAKMVKSLGLDSVLSPSQVVTNQLMRFVRAQLADSGEGVTALYRIHDKVEALEFVVTESSELVGIPIKNLQLKSNVLLCGIVHAGEFILPSGDSVISVGDKVLVVSGAKQITELNQILK